MPASKRIYNRLLGHTASLLLVLLSCLNAAAPALAQSPGTPNDRMFHVLLLNSWHRSFPWTDEQDRGILSALEQAVGKARLDVYVVDLDRRRLPPEASAMYPKLEYILQHIPLDLVVSTDNPAFDLLLSHPLRAQKGIPLVFCGVNNFSITQLEGKTRVSGVAENFLTGRKDTIRAALELQPGTQQLLFILDTSTTAQAIGEEIRVMEKDFPTIGFAYETQENLSLQIDLINRQKPGTLIFPVGIHRDDHGDLMDYGDALQHISTKTTLPCYGFIEDRMGKGLVGGKILTGYDHGFTAGVIGARVLLSGSIQGLEPVMDNPGTFMFDWNQLKRFGLQDKPLPEGAKVINKPMDFWSLYRDWIVVYLIILGLFAALSLSLLLNRKRLLGIQRNLTASQSSLRDSIREQQATLRELYHRTKNNLHVMYSLFMLKAEETTNPQARGILSDMSQRLLAMALVHEKLYESETLSAIFMPDYIHGLVSLVEDNFPELKQHITRNFDLDPIRLSLDHAVPVGMVINELLTNSYRHAFLPLASNPQFKGILLISFRRTGNNLILCIKDNGSFGTDSAEPLNHQHLGLKTITALVEKQLGGTIHFDTANGLLCTITLPAP